MATILIVDDEPGVRELLDDALHFAGYETRWAVNGAEGLDQLRRGRADLCVVDVNMPTLNGFQFLEKLRESGDDTPVLMLSARDAAVDVEQGLRIGADDYVRKPFRVDELLLRIAAILRRTTPEESTEEILSAGAVSMNLSRHEVFVMGEMVDLSATEFRLLEVLLSNPNRLVSREQLLRDVWNIDFDSDTSVLDTYISYLRRKVHRDDFSPITTVRGVGFKLVVVQPS